MSIQLKTFYIKNESDENQMNLFLTDYKVISHTAHYVESVGYWAILIKYDTEGDSKKIEKEKRDQEIDDFNPNDRLLFDNLKNHRIKLAIANGVPAYIIFHNKELISLVHAKPTDVQMLKQISGFDRKKIEKYGQEITEIIKNHLNN